MIKRLVDAIRGKEGYAGMAIYHDGRLIFWEALDPGLADKSRRLYEESEATFRQSLMTAVIRGFTVVTFRLSGLLVVCRLEGQFAIPPSPSEETVEYATGRQEEHPLTREEAKNEAEALLRRLLEKG
jgi:hypothetical protein